MVTLVLSPPATHRRHTSAWLGLHYPGSAFPVAERSAAERPRRRTPNDRLQKRIVAAAVRSYGWLAGRPLGAAEHFFQRDPQLDRIEFVEVDLCPLDRPSKRLGGSGRDDREVAVAPAPVERCDIALGTHSGVMVHARVTHVEHEPTRWAFESVGSGSVDREPVVDHFDARVAR